MPGQFDTGSVGEAPAVSFSVTQPSVDTSAATIVDSLGIAVNAATQIQKSRAQKKQLTAIDGFISEQTLLGDAVAQGRLTSKQAKSKARNNFLRAQADNPGLGQKLIDVHGKIMSQTGLGAIIKEGTEDEQLETARVKEATLAGFAKPSDDVETQAEGVERYFSLKRADAERDSAMKKLALVDKSDSHARMVATEEAKSATLKLSGTLAPQIAKEIDDVGLLVSNGTLSQEEGLDEINALRINYLQNFSLTSARAGGDFANNLKAPISLIFDNASEKLEGKKTLELIERQNKNYLALATNDLLKDETIRNVVALSNQMGNSISGQAFTNKIIHEQMKKFTDPKPKSNSPVTGETSEVEPTLELLKNNLAVANSKQMSADEQQDLHHTMRKVLKSVNIYRSAVEDPAEYNSIITFAASSDYGDYSVANGGVDTELSSQAKDIIDIQYTQEVLPLLKTEYEKVVTTILRAATPGPIQGFPITVQEVPGQSMTEVVEPAFNGSGVTFRLSGDMPRGAGDSVRKSINNLNERVAPLINNLIRSSAHFDGNKNYKAQYDAYFTRIFGTTDDSGSADPQEGD